MPLVHPQVGSWEAGLTTGSHLFSDPETVTVNADDNNISFRVCFFWGVGIQVIIFQ